LAITMMELTEGGFEVEAKETFGRLRSRFFLVSFVGG